MGNMQCNVEFGYQLGICSGTKENLDGVGWSQDLPDANWLLACSPALNSRTLTLVPNLCCCVFLFCFFSFLFSTSCFLQLIVCAYDLDKHQTVYNTYGRNKHICEQVKVTLRPTYESASPSWRQTPILDPQPIFLSPWDFLLDSYCLLCCSALSDERTGL
jgi:hypothetical protein